MLACACSYTNKQEVHIQVVEIIFLVPGLKTSVPSKMAFCQGGSNSYVPFLFA